MAFDLPEGVYTQLIQASAQGFQATMQNGQNMANLAAGALQSAVARNFDEVQVPESAGIARIMNVPMGAPTTPAATAQGGT